MRHATHDVSVILPFSDHEEVVGRACRRLSRHLRELGILFELLAVDEDSGDNSHAVLALLRGSIPELRVLAAGAPGRGLAEGARQARGRVLWLVTPRAALSPLSPFGRAYRHVADGDCDMAVVEGRFTVCHRTRCHAVVESIRGGDGVGRRLARRAEARRLTVERHRLGAGGRALVEGRFSRVLGAIGSSRGGRLERSRS